MTGGNVPGEWSEEETGRLRELVKKWLSAREIGILLGRTRNAVIGKIHRLGLERGQHDETWKGVSRLRRRSTMPKSEKKKSNGFNRPTVARPQAPRRSTTYARPAVAPIVPVNGTGITILELRRDQCHAVIGEPRPAKGLPLYCGNPAWMETPYCEGHHAAFHRHD